MYFTETQYYKFRKIQTTLKPLDCSFSFADINLQKIAPLLGIKPKSLWNYINGYRTPTLKVKEAIEKLAKQFDRERELYQIEVKMNGGN